MDSQVHYLPLTPGFFSILVFLAAGLIILIQLRILRYAYMRLGVGPGAAMLLLVGSLIGFTAYAWLIRNVRTSVVSTYAYVNPVVAVTLGAVFLSEGIGATTLVAGAAIVLAVVLIVRGRSAPAPAPAAGIRAGAPGATLAA